MWSRDRPQPVSSPTGTDHYTVEYVRRTHCSSLAFSSPQYSALWTFLTLVSLDSIPCFLNLEYLLGSSAWVSPAHTTAWNLSEKEVSWRNHRVHPICIPSLKNYYSLLPDIQCLENCILYLCCCYFKQQDKYGPCYYIFHAEHFHYFFYSFICSTNTFVPLLCSEGLRRLKWKSLLHEVAVMSVQSLL